MFLKQDFTTCGRVLKPHGVRGLMRTELSDFDAEEFMDKNAFLFFVIDGTFIPYCVESIEWLTDTEALVKIEDIDDNNAADFFCGRQVLMLNSDAERVGLDALRTDLTGYGIIDNKGGKLGTVTVIDDTTINIIAHTDKGYTLPLHDDFIDDIDDERQTICTHYPQEILDYLVEN